MVRSQAIRTIEALGSANHGTIDIAVSFCHPASASNHPGNGYEQNFERYLARRALECYPEELTAYLETPLAAKQPAVKRIWAQQALGKQSSDSFAKQWQTLQQKPIDRDTLIIVSGASDSAENRKTLMPYFHNADKAPHIAKVALENIADAYSPAFGYPLAESAMTLVRSGQKDKYHPRPQARTWLPHHPPQPRVRQTSVQPPPTNPSSAKSSPHSAIIRGALQKHSSPSSMSHHIHHHCGHRPSPPWCKPSKSKPRPLSSKHSEKPLSKKPASSAPSEARLKAASSSSTSLSANKSKPLTSHSPIAQRIFHIAEKNPTAQVIHQQAEDKKKANVATAMARIPGLEKIADNKAGNTSAGNAIAGNTIVGQSLFAGMCLSCHVVGDQGAGVGPALDGSSEREIDHLLTAILNPDAAAESAYILFRTIESSGLITEGPQGKTRPARHQYCPPRRHDQLHPEAHHP